MILALLTPAILAHGQWQAKYTTYGLHTFRSMSYGLFVPEHYDKRESYPLIVYLHGSRDTVSRDMQWYQPAFQKKHPCFVLTPKCTNPDQGWGNTWTDTHTPEAGKTLALVDSLLKVYNIDAGRQYVYGISMGGFGVFSILAKEQGRFAAAFAICGGSAVNAADKLVNTPLWIFHGDADDVVPVRLSRDVYQEMVNKGGKLVRYTEYPGVKHNSWENALHEESLAEWLLAQQLKARHSPPLAITNFSARKGNDGVVLSWTQPASGAETSGVVWFYRLSRDGVAVREIPGNVNTYLYASGGAATYTVEVVNYFFDASRPASATLR